MTHHLSLFFVAGIIATATACLPSVNSLASNNSEGGGGEIVNNVHVNSLGGNDGIGGYSPKARQSCGGCTDGCCPPDGLGGSGGGGSDVGGSGGGGGVPAPPPQTLKLEVDGQRLLIALDRSKPMDEILHGTTTRWEAARQAINDLVNTYGQIHQFAVATFPNLVFNACPSQSTDEFDIPFGETAGDFQAKLNSSSLQPFTINKRPLNGLLKQIKGGEDNGDAMAEQIIFLTTGANKQCNGNGSKTTIKTFEEQGLHQRSLSFLYLGNDTDNPTTLNAIAEGVGEELHHLNTLHEIKDSLQSIAAEAIACKFKDPYFETAAFEITSLKTGQVETTDKNDWALDGPTLTLKPESDVCKTVKTGAVAEATITYVNGTP